MQVSRRNLDHKPSYGLHFNSLAGQPLCEGALCYSAMNDLMLATTVIEESRTSECISGTHLSDRGVFHTILTIFYHIMRNILFSYWGCGKFYIEREKKNGVLEVALPRAGGPPEFSMLHADREAQRSLVTRLA